MKYILPSEIGKYITKLQGDRTDTAFAASVTLTRQGMLRIRNGVAIPNVHTRAKLGLELVYRVIAPTVNDSNPAEATAAPAKAKKTAKK